MKTKPVTYSISFLIFAFFCTCRGFDETIINTEICEKRIEYRSHSYQNNSLLFEFDHPGFCFSEIKSIEGLYRKRINLQSVYDSSQFQINRNDLRFSDNSSVSFSLADNFENFKFGEIEFRAKYSNSTYSNKLKRIMVTPCTKTLSDGQSQFLPTEQCETSAGTGNRHIIRFLHNGHCISELDSVHITGVFIDENNEELSVSEVSKPRSQITFTPRDGFFTEIEFRVCVTFNFSVKVRTTSTAIYSDGTKSTSVMIDIFNPDPSQKSPTCKSFFAQ
jgi:hypothetical protein